jgi:hypothetical protein
LLNADLGEGKRRTSTARGLGWGGPGAVLAGGDVLGDRGGRVGVAGVAEHRGAGYGAE